MVFTEAMASPLIDLILAYANPLMLLIFVVIADTVNLTSLMPYLSASLVVFISNFT